MDLPQLRLNEGPVRHADCCLSMSHKLFDHLTAILSANLPANHKRTLLSVGSGTGLLEALLLARIESKSHDTDRNFAAQLRVEGVEVVQPGSKVFINKYLPEQASNSVRGTWELSPRIHDDDVSALVFVYPRQPALVTHYVKSAVEMSLGVDMMVWLGPVADWDQFEPCFSLAGDGFKLKTKEQGLDVGLDEYEIMAVFTR